MSARLPTQTMQLLEGIDSKAVGCSERILELLEGGVGGDGVGHVLCPLCSELVAPEPANEGRGKVLKGPDTFGQEFRVLT